MIKKIFQKILLKALSPGEMERLILEARLQNCYKSVTIDRSSKFYEGAKVYNFGNKKSLISIDEGTHIKGELLTFANAGSIKIGSNTYIGEGSRIWSANSIIIGSNVLISHNCNIIDTDSHEIDHIERADSFKKLIHQGHSKEKTNVLTAPIIIGNYAWLSYNVSILKGVKIGEGAIIGAGSIVTKDVPDFTVVAGNPAVHIKNLK